MKPRLLRDVEQADADAEIVRFCELLLAALEVPEIRDTIRGLAEQPPEPNLTPPPPRRTTPAAVRGRGGRRG